MHFVYRLIISFRTLGKIPGMTPAATCNPVTGSCVSTGVSYTRVSMYPQKCKPNGVRSVERESQAVGPPPPIHLLSKVESGLSVKGACLRIWRTGFDPRRRDGNYSSLLRVRSPSCEIRIEALPGDKDGWALGNPPYLFLVTWQLFPVFWRFSELDWELSYYII